MTKKPPSEATVKVATHVPFMQDGESATGEPEPSPRGPAGLQAPENKESKIWVSSGASPNTDYERDSAMDNISLQTDPSRYRHWKLEKNGQEMPVFINENPDHPHKDG